MARPHQNSLTALVLVAAIICAGSATSEVKSAARSVYDDAEISKYIELVAARGLVTPTTPDPRTHERIPSPLPGTRVSESIVTFIKTGASAGKAIIWSEPLGSGLLEFQEGTTPTGQTTVQYWVLESGGRRCILSGGATYGQDGRLLTSNFWRNDPQLRFTGFAELPGDVFPNRIPPNAFLYALDAPEPNTTGKLNMAIGSYGYMTFDLWAEDIEHTSVPAGRFQTLKVIARVDTDSAMKGWPVLLTHLAQPFMPRNILYYDASPPHLLVKFVGSLGYLAPEVTVEMSRAYIASKSMLHGSFGPSTSYDKSASHPLRCSAVENSVWRSDQARCAQLN